MNSTATLDVATAPTSSSEATERALENTVLSPRFYTTDFAAMDRLDISSVQVELDKLMAEFEADLNNGHFVRPADMDRPAAARPT